MHVVSTYLDTVNGASVHMSMLQAGEVRDSVQFAIVVAYFTLVLIEVILACISDASQKTRERFRVRKLQLLMFIEVSKASFTITMTFSYCRDRASVPQYRCTVETFYFDGTFLQDVLYILATKLQSILTTKSC